MEMEIEKCTLSTGMLHSKCHHTLNNLFPRSPPFSMTHMSMNIPPPSNRKKEEQNWCLNAYRSLPMFDALYRKRGLDLHHTLTFIIPKPPSNCHWKDIVLLYGLRPKYKTQRCNFKRVITPLLAVWAATKDLSFFLLLSTLAFLNLPPSILFFFIIIFVEYPLFKLELTGTTKMLEITPPKLLLA